MMRAARVLRGVAAGAAAVSLLGAGAPAPSTPSLSVVALYRERIMLPPGAVLQVRLADVNTEIGEHPIATATLLNPHVPVSLHVAYDPSNIDQDHTYAVSARIALNGELWFATDGETNVITQGNPTHVDLLLKRVVADSPANLEDRRWVLSEMGERQVTGENRPYIGLRGGHISGSGGCNRLVGGYKLNGKAITFTPIASSMMMCIHEGVMENESAFFKALEHVRYWTVTGERLELLDGEHKVVLRLTAQN